MGMYVKVFENLCNMAAAGEFFLNMRMKMKIFGHPPLLKSSPPSLPSPLLKKGPTPLFREILYALNFDPISRLYRSFMLL